MPVLDLAIGDTPSSKNEVSPSISAKRQRAAHLPWYGVVGVTVMVVNEALMFARVQPFHDWITPMQWTAYLLVMDALLVKYRRESFILDHRSEFLAMLTVSYVFWLMFEGYNLHLQNWVYVNAPVHPAILFAGSLWAFSAVFPAILLTSEVVDALGWCRRTISRRESSKAFQPPGWAHPVLVAIGLLLCGAPLLVSSDVAQYLFVAVWIGFAPLLDPVNYRLGRPSRLRALQGRNTEKLFSLFVGGLGCGLLWEFWNYWAGMKWIYTIPYFNRPKIFEMPLYGYLGFLAFAVDCYVIWHFVRGFLPESWKTTSNGPGLEPSNRSRTLGERVLS